jgi:hypothetical protein
LKIQIPKITRQQPVGLSQSRIDKQELAEDLKVMKENAELAAVLVDSGFVSEAAIEKI